MLRIRSTTKCPFFQDVKTVKDLVESLHRKIDLLSGLMTSVETRLDAIEAGICLVPLSFQGTSSVASGNSSSPLDRNMQSLTDSESLPSLSQSMTTTTPQTHQQKELQSSLPSNAQLIPLPVTPTHHPRSSTSISPIVSSLPKEKANKLKQLSRRTKSRKKFTRKFLEELFTEEELATSNVAGNAGKEKLDVCKVGLVNRKCCHYNRL